MNPQKATCIAHWESNSWIDGDGFLLCGDFQLDGVNWCSIIMVHDAREILMYKNILPALGLSPHVTQAKLVDDGDECEKVFFTF